MKAEQQQTINNMPMSEMIEKCNPDGKYDNQKLSDFITEQRSRNKQSDDQIIEYMKYEHATENRLFSKSYIEKKILETAKLEEGKIETGTLAEDPYIEVSDRARIINEYNAAAQALSKAQRRLAKASKELDDFNTRK